MFEANRSRLFGLAYRMLGEAAEAEDVVQDAYLRWRQHADTVATPASWLTKVTTNLCLGRLTSARARREHYVGPWLPEPILTSTDPGPLETVEQHDTLSLGVLMLLERLTPLERAAFVLREAFDCGHREIAEILDLDEAHVRQLYRRARQHVGEPRKRFPASAEQGRRILERFLAAAVSGDVAGLARLLAEDAVAWSDGGGKVTAARHPVIGRDKVARLFVGLGRSPRTGRAALSLAEVNGTPAVLVHEAGALSVVIVPEIVDGRVVAVHSVLNPDKLAFASAQSR